MKCPKCGKEIVYKKVGNKSIPCNTTEVFAVPKLHGDTRNFVSNYGAFIKGVESDDGIKCNSVHVCKSEKITDENEEKIVEKKVRKFEQLSLFA